MKLKQMILMAGVAILALTGCKKLPPFENLSSDFVVYNWKL